MRNLLLGCGLLGVLGASHADPEIMVHEGDLARPGEVAATLHANYTPRGDQRRDDGTWPSHRLISLMPEFATGLAPGWEVGIHLPFMRAGVDGDSARRGAWGSSAVMVRLKHVRQHGKGVFWGFNAEYDLNAGRYLATPRGAEFRGIVGWDAAFFRLTANPHLIWAYGGSEASQVPDFNVDWKILHKASADFAWGIELYTDWGKVDDLRPGAGDRTLYLIAETRSRLGALHFGFGRGFKETPEHTVVKAVWATTF